MKKKYIPMLCLFFLLASCTGMNDIIQEYLDRGEINYIGRPDSLKTNGGNERMELRWIVGKDPRVEGFIIYWNNRQDSIEGQIDLNTLVEDKKSKKLYYVKQFPIKEGSYELEVVQTGSKGYNSISSTVTCNVYGNKYISQLTARNISTMIAEQNEVKISWEASDCKYVDFTYDTAAGTKETRRILSNVNEVTLTNPKSSGNYSYETYYVPGKDSLDAYKAPQIIEGILPDIE